MPDKNSDLEEFGIDEFAKKPAKVEAPKRGRKPKEATEEVVSE